MSHPNALYLTGPTASGKSSAAHLLAERLEAEIISVDSMQVYRGMDIGTAKSTPEERTRIPHHLIDVADLDETFDVARFITLAREAELQIRARGKVPLFCGGTGLYFKSLAAGVGEAPPRDKELRLELEKTPLEQLLIELQRSDPETYTKIDQQNSRRVIRAVEVVRLTGRPFSESRSDWTPHHQEQNWFGLHRDRADLNNRINARVDEMFERGLVEETRSLVAKRLEKNQTAMQALGYRQVVEYLRGIRDLDATIELVKVKTRQFAKRQVTWFKRQLQLDWISVAPNETPSETASRILEMLK